MYKIIAAILFSFFMPVTVQAQPPAIPDFTYRIYWQDNPIFGFRQWFFEITNLDDGLGQYMHVPEIALQFGKCNLADKKIPSLENRTTPQIANIIHLYGGFTKEDSEYMAYNEDFPPPVVSAYKKYIPLGETLTFPGKPGCKVDVVDITIIVEGEYHAWRLRRIN